MANTTNIQWCDTTVNPIMGCLGCELWGTLRKSCYAGVMTGRFAGRPGWPTEFTKPIRTPGRTAQVARLPDLAGSARPGKPWLDGMPRLIFVSDMGDAFTMPNDDDLDYLFREVILVACAGPGRRHVWLWLTKRPAMFRVFAKWLAVKPGIEWPANVWMGTSVTDDRTTVRARSLADVPVDVTKFVSVEPQIGPVVAVDIAHAADWVIHGGESGQDARPFDVGWVEDFNTACIDEGVPYFVKQLGARPIYDGYTYYPDRPLHDSHGGDWDEWDVNMQVREVPRERALACTGHAEVTT